MRDGYDALEPFLENPTKEIGLTATFRKTLPVFTSTPVTDSLGLTDPALIDQCNWGTGILRVTSFGNVLYTQYISDLNAAFPAWTNTGIALKALSLPAVDDGYVWYQKADGGVVYRYFGTWGTEVSARSMPNYVHIAPIANRAYAYWQRNAGSFEIVSLHNQESSHFTVYGATFLSRVDVVEHDGTEYFYISDMGQGRVVEIKHTGNAVTGKDTYGVIKPVLPIDAIDEVFSFKPGYASVINNKVVVTGQLVRTSDDTSVEMDVYCAGPEYFSLGRDMFIKTGTALRGKMLRVNDEFVVAGATTMWRAKATNIFGGSTHSDLVLTTQDFANISLTEAEARSTNLTIDMDPELAHDAIAPGSDIELEMAYDTEWMTLATLNLEADNTSSNEEGRDRIVSGVGKSAKRLSSWSPDHGVWIPSQAKMYSNPASMSQVIRAAGLWESTDPEDPDAPVRLKGMNELGVLYSVARASRGGAMRGLFYYPSDAYFTPYYGVAINYYRESAAEAAERLGVDVNDLEDDMFGHNGIVAIFSPTEHTGSTPGIGLYLWRDSVLTKVTSASLSIPADTWHWLQIEFIEGEVRVKYRLSSSATWTEALAYLYSHATVLPWKRETLGRGAIVMKNVVPSTTSYPLGHEDTTLGVESNSSFPSSGTVLVDNEEMAYTSKSSTTPPSNFSISFSKPPGWPISPKIFKLTNEAYRSQATVGYPTTGKIASNPMGFSYLSDTSDFTALSAASHGYLGLAMILLPSCTFSGEMRYFPHGNRTFRVVDHQNAAPSTWITNDFQYPLGWEQYIGDGTKGAYGSLSGPIFYTDVNLHQLLGFSTHPSEDAVLGSYRGMFVLKPALHISARGFNGTTAIAHGVTTAHLSRGKYVLCEVAASFSQDEDQSIEDAVKTITRMAGGEVTCKAMTDMDYAFTAGSMRHAVSDHKNLIASIELPALNDGSGVGIAFRSNTSFSYGSNRPYPSDGTSALWVEVERSGSSYLLTLYSTTSSGRTNLERIPIRPSNFHGAATANVPVGTLKVSVQDNLISVWLNGRYLHTFYNNTNEDGVFVAFTSKQAGTLHIHLSELDDLLADIVVGTRGNGMSVLSELIADRHILWRDEPDGSLFFYRTRDEEANIPDIISAISDGESDSMITRIRSEGLNVSEMFDEELLRAHGNSFVTINARHANNVVEARREAELIIDENWRNSLSKRYMMDVHPGIQVGDGYFFIDQPGGVMSVMLVRGLSINIGFAGNGFVADMQCDVIPLERA